MKYMPTTTFVRIAMSLALVVSAAGVAVTPVAAQGDQPDWAVEMFDDMAPMVERYNENINADDLGIAASQLRNENVELVVNDPANGTTATVSFRMDEDLQIQELEMGTRGDATIRMTTDKATMDRIIESNNPSVAFQNAVSPPAAEITISGLGTISQVKWIAINVVADVLENIFG